MVIKQLIEVFDLLDGADANGYAMKELLESRGAKDVTVTTIQGDQGKTDFIKVLIPGKNGKSSGGTARTFGVVGRLGGIGARPKAIGMVSDADGCLVAMTAALKLADMQRRGDVLEGDVILTTHVCPDAPTMERKPVMFMGSPVPIDEMNHQEVDSRMEAILSIDGTKGNKMINKRGFSISATVKEGFIYRVADDLLDIQSYVTGEPPVVFPITMQDITPYGNDLYHINSIILPSIATDAPVVGVGINTATVPPGHFTNMSQMTDLESATRFVLAVADHFTRGNCNFYSEEDYQNVQRRYGSFKHLQTHGNV